MTPKKRLLVVEMDMGQNWQIFFQPNLLSNAVISKLKRSLKWFGPQI
jgi:hypothetical protein